MKDYIFFHQEPDFYPTAECYGVFVQCTRFRGVLGELGRFREGTGLRARSFVFLVFDAFRLGRNQFWEPGSGNLEVLRRFRVPGSGDSVPKVPKVTLYFESIILHFESTLFYFENILLYFESIVVSFESILLYFERILMYFESMLLYFESCFENIFLYFESLLLYFEV